MRLPCDQELYPVLVDERPKPAQLLPAKTTAPLQSNRYQPELRQTVVALDVNVRRLAPISGKEEEPVRSEPGDRWHAKGPLATGSRVSG
jgi:hypothetical protein